MEDIELEDLERWAQVIEENSFSDFICAQKELEKKPHLISKNEGLDVKPYM
jgi:hypothetical protein